MTGPRPLCHATNSAAASIEPAYGACSNATVDRGTSFNGVVAGWPASQYATGVRRTAKEVRQDKDERGITQPPPNAVGFPLARHEGPKVEPL